MALYIASSSPTAPSTTNCVLTITAAAVRRTQVHEISVAGQGTASAANELGTQRATTVGITPVSYTPLKVDPLSAAAAGVITVMTGASTSGWTTEPVSTQTVGLRLGCNSNGGIYRWVAKPGEEIALYDVAVTTGQLMIKFSLGGAQQMSVMAVFEEF